MARNQLPLSRYEAEMVWMPEREGERKEMEVLRVVVFGPNFPQRAVEPELLVGGQVGRQASIGGDQKSIRAYFFQIPPDKAVIRVRYGDSLEGELPERFARKRIRALDEGCDRGG